MPKRDLYLLAYDIVKDRRRARTLAAVRAFGLDGQFSVHECLLTQGERRELWRKLTQLADPGADRLLLLRLDPRLERRTLGRPPLPPLGAMSYVG